MEKELTGLMSGIGGKTKRTSGMASDTEVNKTKSKTGVTDSQRGSLSYSGMNVGSGAETRRTRSNSSTKRSTTEIQEQKQKQTEEMQSELLESSKQSIRGPVDNTGEELMTLVINSEQEHSVNFHFGTFSTIGEISTIGTLKPIRRIKVLGSSIVIR
jgi:hypothetical protein